MTRMKNLVACIALLGVFLAGCGQAPPPSDATPITLGSILILTGDGAGWGNASKNGIELAVEDLNTRGGILGRDVRVIHEDDQSDPKVALSAFRKLTEIDRVDYIIGTTWSHTGLPLIDLVREKGIVMISPSLGKAEFNESSDHIFNTWPHDFILSEKLAELVYDNGHRTVAIFGAEQVWVKEQTQAFKNRFEALGGTVAFVFEPQIHETDVATDVLKVKNHGAIDAIVYTSSLYQLGIQTARKMVEFAVSLPAYSLSLDNDIIRSAQGAYDGMIFLTFLTPENEFAKRYEERYGLAVDIGADSAYDAVMMMAQAMEKTGSTDPDAVAVYLNELAEYTGVSGHLVADGKGGFTKDYVTKMIVNGKAVTVD